jgi:hypothetical protein
MCSRKEAQVTRMPADKPDLIVDPGDLPATARELRDLLAASGRFFDRGVPVKIVPDANGRAPNATELTPNKVVMAAHDFCRPVREQGGSGRGASDLNPKERGGYDPAFSRADAEGDCSCRM